MKKLNLLALASLALTGAANLAAYNWEVTNGLGRHVCVTVNASGQRIRQDIEPGETKIFGFGGWKSGLCLTSVAVKEFAEGCPAGLTDIGKASIRTIAGTDFDNLVNAVETAAVTGVTAAVTAGPTSGATEAAASSTQSATEAASSVTQTAMKTAASGVQTTSQTASATQTGLIGAITKAIQSSFGLISKLCKGGKFVIVEDKDGNIQVLGVAK